ncbi:IS4 family transposase [Neptuniibacter marinus]|uniref:IS4 family transposase n=1 Tax=Neptuniibacter marinus TaxID=1806670 RepID=UPI003B5A85E7
MSHHNTAFHQLLQPLPRHEFEALAKQHHQGQKLRSASRWDKFIGMSMSQLSGRQSLRDIESSLRSQQHKLYHLGAKPIARTTLARLNEKQPAELYEAVFYKLLQRCSLRDNNHKFRFKNPLYSLDASVIDLSLKLFPWAQCHQTKVAMKLHVGLNNASLIPEFTALSHGLESELIKGRQFRFPKGSIVAFDKGYNDYSWYGLLSKQEVSFVTRLRPNAVYEVIEHHQSAGVDYDQSIRLTSQHAQKQGAPKLRLVGFTCPETKRQYRFITNNFKLAASTIAAIYKDRWQVELFFKAIKQNLKIKAFLGSSQNAVMTQIWIAMISYLLLAYARHCAKKGWTVQRVMRILQLSLFERKALKELLNPSPPERQKRDPQMRIPL